MDIQKAIELAKAIEGIVSARDSAIIEKCKARILLDHPGWDAIANSLDSVLSDINGGK
jgi:hypothetical protein